MTMWSKDILFIIMVILYLWQMKLAFTNSKNVSFYNIFSFYKGIVFKEK